MIIYEKVFLEGATCDVHAYNANTGELRWVRPPSFSRSVASENSRGLKPRLRLNLGLKVLETSLLPVVGHPRPLKP